MFKDHQWIATIGRTSPAAFASRKTYGSQNRRLSSSGQFSGDNFCRQAGTAFGDGIDNVPLKFNDLLLVRARISQNSERNPRLRLRPRGPCANSTVDVAVSKNTKRTARTRKREGRGPYFVCQTMSGQA
jgi:hypothetical protein